ncbi:MAG: hypothetical protein KC933_13325 [Myxococcales bacterium]|nr:hypothetical protein [Myxococcales bacterium]
MKTHPLLMLSGALVLTACGFAEDPSDTVHTAAAVCADPVPGLPPITYPAPNTHSVNVACNFAGKCTGSVVVNGPLPAPVSVLVNLRNSDARPAFYARAFCGMDSCPYKDWRVIGRAWARYSTTGCWSYLGEEIQFAGPAGNSYIEALTTRWPLRGRTVDAVVVEVREIWTDQTTLREFRIGATNQGAADGGVW